MLKVRKIAKTDLNSKLDISGTTKDRTVKFCVVL